MSLGYTYRQRCGSVLEGVVVYRVHDHMDLARLSVSRRSEWQGANCQNDKAERDNG